jgi:hypothetical protein
MGTGSLGRGSEVDRGHWRSQRVSGLGSRSSSRRRRPVHRGSGLGDRDLCVGFSRPRMTVASRLICPNNCCFTKRATKASGTRSAIPWLANSTDARENVASEGSSLGVTKPQIRLRFGEARKAPMVARVVGGVSSVLRTKARAMAWRSHGFRPKRGAGRPGNFLIWSNSKRLNNYRSLWVKGRSQHSSRRGNALAKP